MTKDGTLLLRSEFFDNADIHFWLYDKDLNLIDVYEATLRFYHLKKRDLIGKNYMDFSPRTNKQEYFEKFQEVIRTGEPLIYEDQYGHPKYGNQYNRFKAFPVGQGLGITATNVTQLKNTIEALELFNYRASHDIRSPLANISAMADLALEYKGDEGQILEFCRMVKEQAERLNSTLHGLIDRAKSLNGPAPVQLIDFRALIGDVKKSLSFTEGYGSITFMEAICIERPFYGERPLLVSLFQNLIDNSIKYRDRSRLDSMVRITVADDFMDGFAKITVADNGMGIKEKHQKDIFKIFHRATDSGTGYGLGLYTLRYSIEKIGGHMVFESKENEGTVFTVYMPTPGSPKLSVSKGEGIPILQAGKEAMETGQDF